MANDSPVGRRVLVAEDEYMLADDMRLDLEDQGIVVVGPAGTMADLGAILSSGENFDAAILDINLAGETIYAAASVLRERQVPFVFATGYDVSFIPEDFRDVACIEKPIDLRRVLDAFGWT